MLSDRTIRKFPAFRFVVAFLLTAFALQDAGLARHAETGTSEIHHLHHHFKWREHTCGQGILIKTVSVTPGSSGNCNYNWPGISPSQPYLLPSFLNGILNNGDAVTWNFAISIPRYILFRRLLI